VSNKDMKKFGQVLKSLVCLEKVGFKFDKFNQIPDNNLQKLGQALVRLNYLQAISLDFSTYRMTETGLEEFGEALQKIIRLTSLDLSFEWGMFELENLSQKLGTLTSLTDFSFKCENYSITDDRLQHLAKALQEMVRLESLKLNFKESPYIKEDGLQELGHSLQALTSLRVLNVDFGHCEKLTEKGIKSLCKSLESLVSLETIQLNFEKCFGIAELETLGEALTTLVCLRNLTLNFEHIRNCGRGVPDQGLHILGETLQKLISLESLQLKLDDWTGFGLYNETGQEGFSSGLETLTSLRSLSLNFRRCALAIDAGFDTIFVALEKLDLLENLELDFNSCHFYKRCEDTGFDGHQLSQSLKSLSCLQNVSLHFAYSGIDDSDAQMVIQALERLSFLKSINLEFAYCHLLTDGVLEKMSQVFRTLRCLESVTLDFSRCDEMTEAGKECFEQEFKSLKFIRNKHIKF